MKNAISVIRNAYVAKNAKNYLQGNENQLIL
jgi:hypothetical protein